MRERLYIKNKQFLRNFLIVLFCMLIIAFMIVRSVYQTSFNTLQQEIEGISESKTHEVANRVEEVLKTCNEMIITLSLMDMVKMYFVSPDPEYYVENFYSDISASLNAQKMSYIDSIILYAPEHGRMFYSSENEQNIYIENHSTSDWGDTSWLDIYENSQESKNLIFTRVKSGGWPYYLTVMKRWNSSTTEGAILVNINLDKLYDYILMDNESSMQLYVIDNNNKVIMSENKAELNKQVKEVEGLEKFRTMKSYGELSIEGKDVFTYEQLHLNKYGLTCVSITPVGDYFARLSQLQIRLIWIICFAAIVAVSIACVYSMNVTKPKHENRLLKEELNESVDLLKDSRLVALQTQINPHFMFNTLNTASLMIESDCGDGHPAASLLGGLSDILRYSLSKNTVCIREELACIEKYLSIMQYRYGEFEVLIDADEEIYDYAIPKLILQPLIENALQHGISLCMDARTGRIEIRVKEVMYAYANGKEQRSVCFDISDNGMGIDEEKLEKLRTTIQNHKIIPEEHIGLYNVAQRLYLLYHEEQEVTIESTFSKGTHIRLIFPITIRE